MGGGMEAPEGGYIYTYIYKIMTHSCVVCQKPAQHCKAIILQLKKRKGLPKNFKESETKMMKKKTYRWLTNT